MLTMMELKEKTDRVFGITTSVSDALNIVPSELKVPEPPIHWKDKLEALAEAKLDKQRASLLFDMRCWQAEKMGFEKLVGDDIPEMLMGERYTETKSRDDIDRQTYEFFYNHHTGVTLLGKDCLWGGHPQDYVYMHKVKKWFLAPFKMEEKWRVRFGKLDYLKREIPYGVVLRLQEVKELNLFNVFNVFAPIEAWERKTDIDPVVVASIWEIPPVGPKESGTAGQTAHYFLAQW